MAILQTPYARQRDVDFPLGRRVNKDSRSKSFLSSRSRRPLTKRVGGRPNPRSRLQPLIYQILPPAVAISVRPIVPLRAATDPGRSFAAEQTSSAYSILSANIFETQHNDHDRHTCTDKKAAWEVEYHYKGLPSDGIHEQELRNLICKHGLPHIDSDALDRILAAVDSVFFRGALIGRVRWGWSHPEEARYMTEIVGTTALKRAAQGGYETLIVLSDPILNQSGCHPRLLISAFIHELIHCYLFISCGFKARREGGHTDGFHTIAAIIDNWVGKGHLYLCNTTANLSKFRQKSEASDGLMLDMSRKHSHLGYSPPSYHFVVRPRHLQNSEWGSHYTGH